MNTPLRLKSSVQDFREDYGVIPDQISYGGITVSSSRLKSVICFDSWFDDLAISAFLGLVDSEETVTFDSLFITQMNPALHHGSIESAADFPSHQYSSHGLRVLIHRLRQCRSVLIPLFNGDHTGNGNHWGLSVLRKETATIYLYGSLYLQISLHMQAGFLIL